MIRARAARPAAGLALYLWFYMRASAVLMIGLVLGHLYVMHIINSTDTIDFQFVAQRFATPFWRAYDLFILSFALSHGLIGLRGILDDYVHARPWRAFAEGALWSFGAVFFLLGALILVTLQPGMFARP
jgi:succinate dehydrogenase / fumarate reductase membrane anchor subunit